MSSDSLYSAYFSCRKMTVLNNDHIHKRFKQCRLRNKYEVHGKITLCICSYMQGCFLIHLCLEVPSFISTLFLETESLITPGIHHCR